jgi:undecaprenyl-diphosphatase
MSIFQAVVLGIVEGLTEFLPVSSTGHQTIVAKLLGLTIDDPSVTSFIAVIQVGAIAALVLYLWRDIVRLAVAWVRGLLSAAARRNPDYKMAWLTILGSVPIVLAGVLGRDLVKGPLRSLWVVAVALIVWGFVMMAAEAIAKQDRAERSMRWWEALVIGLVQALALVPGVSRSGATISAGLALGFKRVDVTRFGFLLGIPALVGAAVLETPEALSGGVGWLPTLVGTVVSFGVAYLSVGWMLRFVSRHTIRAFVWYRWVLGAGLVVALSAGWLTAT